MKFEEFEQLLNELELIAKQFPRGSQQYQAIEIAAKALLFVQDQQEKAQFEKFLASEDLTFDQREHLKRMGILE